jgi:hypothetical protein
MTAPRIARAPLVAVCAALAVGSCTRGGAASAARADSSFAASEAMMLSFRDSVRDQSKGVQASRTRSLLSLRAPDSLDACSYPLPAYEVTRHSMELVTIELPADFKLTRNGDTEPMKKLYGYSRYEWTAGDRSTVRVDAVNNYDGHTGWTGLVESECNVDIGGRAAHLDVANATVEYEDRIVHAQIDMVPELAVMFLGHARSRRRQAELLNAVHSLRISSAWGAGKY